MIFAASYSSHCSRSVNVRSDKSLSNNFRELEMNSWNSVVSGPTGEEWGEFRKPGEPGEREDLDEQGVRGEDWDEAELNVRSLTVVPQVPDVTSSVFLWRGDKCPDIRWLSSASCSASLIMECICTKVFARVFADFLFICGSVSPSSSTDMGELARSAIAVSTGAASKALEWEARGAGRGEFSEDEAMGDGVPSESWPMSRNTRLHRIRKKKGSIVSMGQKKKIKTTNPSPDGNRSHEPPHTGDGPNHQVMFRFSHLLGKRDPYN